MVDIEGGKRPGHRASLKAVPEPWNQTFVYIMGYQMPYLDDSEYEAALQDSDFCICPQGIGESEAF